MNRRLYWTLVNFGKMIGMILTIIVSAALIVFIAQSSKEYFGSGVPAFILAGIIGIGFFSYKMSEFDVDRERHEQERVERALKKDWE
jgi:hypothetical protein